MDRDAFDEFFTAHDLVTRAGIRQRPFVQSDDVNEQPLASLRRMLGQDALDRIFTGITDPEDSDTDDSGADEPRDSDPGFFRLPGGGTVHLPGGGDPGWSAAGPARIDRGIDPGKLIDDGVYRVPPGTDPFHPIPGAKIEPMPYFFRDHLGSSKPLVKLFGYRIAANRPPGNPVPAMVPETMRGVTRPASVRVDASSSATTYRSPASGSPFRSQPPGAGVSQETQPKPSAEPAQQADGSPAGRRAISVQPTAALVETLVSAAVELATSHAESAAEMSIDHLRQEIFDSQTARNSLMPH